MIFTNSKLSKRSFHSKQNNLREFKNDFDNLKLLCNDTKKNKPNNEDHKEKKKKKHLIIRKAVINTGCELYNKLHTCNSIRSILNSSEKI